MRNGYLFLPSVLSREQCAKLRSHIDEHANRFRRARHHKQKKHIVFKCMFEEHPIEEHPIDSVEIFKIPEVRKICEELIKCCGTSRENDACLKIRVVQ